MHLIVIAGAAGSGKSTLAEGVALVLDAPHLDFDIVSHELLAVRHEQLPHLTASELLESVKDERYTMLAAAVRDMSASTPVAGTSRVAVVSAPFTRHGQDPEMWNRWLASCGAVDGAQLFWLSISPSGRLARIQERAASRDGLLLSGTQAPSDVPPPKMPHHLIDAELPTAYQVALVTAAMR